MGNWIYKFNCAVCGVYTERYMSSRQTKQCYECGLETARRAAYEMATKKGPAWDRFTQSRGATGRPPKPKKAK